MLTSSRPQPSVLRPPRVLSRTLPRPLLLRRVGHTATLLEDGRILIVGGALDFGTRAAVQTSVELFDPLTQTLTLGPPMAKARAYHVAALLPDGTVLVAGGLGPNGALASAERFDPLADMWLPADRMHASRFEARAVVLPGGRVLVVGGAGSAAHTSDLFDFQSGTWTPAMLTQPRTTGHAALLLASGEVLVVGAGLGSERHDKGWRRTGSLSVARTGAGFGALPNGQVLLSGGRGPSGLLRSTEVYDPTADVWSPGPTLAEPRTDHVQVVLPGGGLLVVGGFGREGPVAALEHYDLRSICWRRGGRLTVPRWRHTATVLPDGRVIVLGGLGLGANAEAGRAIEQLTAVPAL